jgi:hypothetical protein
MKGATSLMAAIPTLHAHCSPSDPGAVGFTEFFQCRRLLLMLGPPDIMALLRLGEAALHALLLTFHLPLQHPVLVLLLGAAQFVDVGHPAHKLQVVIGPTDRLVLGHILPDPVWSGGEEFQVPGQPAQEIFRVLVIPALQIGTSLIEEPCGDRVTLLPGGILHHRFGIDHDGLDPDSVPGRETPPVASAAGGHQPPSCRRSSAL